MFCVSLSCLVVFSVFLAYFSVLLCLTSLSLFAVGENNIPDEERFYAEVYWDSSLSSRAQPLCVFLRQSWTVGRALDGICRLADITNNNNDRNAKVCVDSLSYASSSCVCLCFLVNSRSHE